MDVHYFLGCLLSVTYNYPHTYSILPRRLNIFPEFTFGDILAVDLRVGDQFTTT